MGEMKTHKDPDGAVITVTFMLISCHALRVTRYGF